MLTSPHGMLDSQNDVLDSQNDVLGGNASHCRPPYPKYGGRLECMLDSKNAMLGSQNAMLGNQNVQNDCVMGGHVLAYCPPIS